MKLINALKRYKKLGFDSIYNENYQPKETRIDDMIEIVKKYPENYEGNYYTGGECFLSAYISSKEKFWYVKKYKKISVEEQVGDNFDWIMRDIYSSDNFQSFTLTGVPYSFAVELQKHLSTEVFWKVFASIYSLEVKPIKAELYFTQDSMGRRIKDLYDVKVSKI